MGQEPLDDENDVLLRFVEQFALVLVESGLSRMPARVFAYVLADDDDRYTANELAQGLRVSPAAISGAVRTLVQAGLLAKEREPGSRADHYRVYDDDIWSHITMQRVAILQRYEDVLAAGVQQLGATRGSRRLAETLNYMAFMRDEIPRTVVRWQQVRERAHGRESAPE